MRIMTQLRNFVRLRLSPSTLAKTPVFSLITRDCRIDWFVGSIYFAFRRTHLGHFVEKKNELREVNVSFQV